MDTKEPTATTKSEKLAEAAGKTLKRNIETQFAGVATEHSAFPDWKLKARDKIRQLCEGEIALLGKQPGRAKDAANLEAELRHLNLVWAIEEGINKKLSEFEVKES